MFEYRYDSFGNTAGTTMYGGGDEKAATTYTYDAAGNLIKKAAPDGTTEYTYTAQNKLKTGKTEDGQSSTYTYNALNARIKNVQVRDNKNAGHANSDLKDGSHGTDYLDFLMDGRFFWQRTWETEVGTTFQSNFETVTKNYVVDYLSIANRDILVTEDGSFTQRYVYDENSTRISQSTAMQLVQSVVRAAKTCKVTLLQTMYARYGIAPATLQHAVCRRRKRQGNLSHDL